MDNTLAKTFNEILERNYNHEKFMAGVRQGWQIVNNTDFAKAKSERMQAVAKLSKGLKVVDVANGQVYIIDEIIDEQSVLGYSLVDYTKTGKLRKQARACWLNPVNLRVYHE